MPLHISTDKDRLDLDVIHGFLSQAYWSRGIPRETVQRAITGSLCFGGYLDGVGQVAFARVVTDGATFAYLADVFVPEDQRGKGYSKQLMQAILAHPQLQGLRRFMLATWDAHGLYAQFGFQPTARPDRLMEKLDMDLYTRNVAPHVPSTT
jgi:GNAT superfamily N-acetyltransferase